MPKTRVIAVIFATALVGTLLAAGCAPKEDANAVPPVGAGAKTVPTPGPGSVIAGPAPVGAAPVAAKGAGAAN